MFKTDNSGQAIKEMKGVEISIPVYNEEMDIPKNIPRLYDFCARNLGNYNWQIIIVDNASIDSTWKKIQDLCAEFPLKIEGLRLDRKGRGWALRNAWKKSKADYLAYMDIDLSSDLAAFPKMLNLLDQGYDLVIGSRNLPDSLVIGRKFFRAMMSKTYIRLVRLIHGIRLSDTQCGFKAVRTAAFLKVEPLIENNLWFFDTEMIIIMEKLGFKLKDVPIKWEDSFGTTVKIVKDSWEEFSGLLRLFKNRPWEAEKVEIDKKAIKIKTQ